MMLNNNFDDKFDFDAAARLAKTDPEAFERRRQHLIEALIANVSERNREHLRRVQWRVDRERERAANPMDACLRVYRMMWDSFAGEHGMVAAIERAGELPTGTFHKEAPRARVLPLRRANGE